jgi:hypothetical protein
MFRGTSTSLMAPMSNTTEIGPPISFLPVRAQSRPSLSAPKQAADLICFNPSGALFRAGKRKAAAQNGATAAAAVDGRSSILQPAALLPQLRRSFTVSPPLAFIGPYSQSRSRERECGRGTVDQSRNGLVGSVPADRRGAARCVQEEGSSRAERATEKVFDSSPVAPVIVIVMSPSSLFPSTLALTCGAVRLAFVVVHEK